MQVTVKALDSFFHGRQSAVKNDTFKVGKGEADELVKSGLVEIVADEPSMKMDEPIENKMEAEPENKSTSTRKKGA